MIIQSVNVVNQLEDGINATRDALLSYNDSVKSKATELQDKNKKQKEAILTKVQVSLKIILLSHK